MADASSNGCETHAMASTVRRDPTEIGPARGRAVDPAMVPASVVPDPMVRATAHQTRIDRGDQVRVAGPAQMRHDPHAVMARRQTVGPASAGRRCRTAE